MRVTFLGHATHLIEASGLRVLTDPWLVDPVFGGLAERSPPLAFGPADLPPIDAIAITHAHLDHFNAPTLAALDRNLPVVHPPIRFTELDRNLRRLGFTNLHPRHDFEPFELGDLRIVPTPSRGVLDECAYLIEGPTGCFWDGADAPQPPDLAAEIAQRFGPIDLGAYLHNSFDLPALLGLPSFKEADHGPEEAALAAKTMAVDAAFGAASNMRWRGPHGANITGRVVRRSACEFLASLERLAPQTAALDLQPGDAWSREGGVERNVFKGAPAGSVPNDVVHVYLETGERFTGPSRPSIEDTFRRDLPARLAAAPDAARYVGQSICIEIEGDDAGTWTVDFRIPSALPKRGDDGAPYALRVTEDDWKDLFERRLPWQVLLVSDRIRVTRVRRGAPPEGLHFVHALQAVFP